MEELSIKIRIAGRDYPMKVRASEEARLRTAGKQLAERMKNFRENYGIQDVQDLLAMVAFDCFAERLSSEGSMESFQQDVEDTMSSIDSLVTSALKKSTEK